MIVGMLYYSRRFTLADPACSTPCCRISSAGEAGKYFGTVGVLPHPQIQDIIKENAPSRLAAFTLNIDPGVTEHLQ